MEFELDGVRIGTSHDARLFAMKTILNFAFLWITVGKFHRHSETYHFESLKFPKLPNLENHDSSFDARALNLGDTCNYR